jgi:soluble lytic murein transglycosylase-like protein
MTIRIEPQNRTTFRGRFIQLCCGLPVLLAIWGTTAHAADERSTRAAGTSYHTKLLISRSQTLYMNERAARAVPAKAVTQSDTPVRKGLKNRIHSPYADDVYAASRAANVDAALIHAVILVESGYNAAARSEKGAVGLMQLMPDTARRYGVMDPLNPTQNIHGGARYLRDLQLMFNNDLQLVLAAYNAGENAVVKFGNRIPPYAETIAYVPRVMTQYRRLRNQ